MEGCYATATFEVARMAEAADDPYAAAVDLVEWLVARGVAFREAHRRVGALVADALATGTDLAAAVAAADGLGEEAAALLAPGVAVTRRTTPGGAGPVPAAAQRTALVAALTAARARLGALRTLDLWP